MPFLSVHEVEIFYSDEGAGAPVVLGHSSTGSGGQWRALIADLRDRYRLLAPDHVGYGRSGAFPGHPPLVALEVDAIEALIERAGAPVHLVGHSYGASILARVAVCAPDRVRSLTLYEPTLFHLLAACGRADALAEIRAVAGHVERHSERGDRVEAARGFIDYWIGPGAFDAMDERVRAAIAGAMDKLRVEWRGAFEPAGAASDRLAALSMPIALLAGARTTSAARAVVDVLRGIWPQAGYAEIEGAGHMGPVTDPGLVNPAIAEFLASVDDR